MKRGIIILICLIIACISAFLIFKSKGQPTNTATKETKTKQFENVEKLDTPIRPNIEADHVWRFSFKGEIDKKTIQNKVYILNEEKQRVPVEVDVNNNEILVRPPQEGYGKDKTYELFVEKDIKQVDGKNIEPIHFTFITKRDEVAKAIFRKDFIKINKKQVDKIEDNKLIIKDSQLKGKIKKDSMIAIQTGDEKIPEIARKAESVKEERDKIIVDTVTPQFEELFDELDLYEKIPITSEHIKLEPIEGLTLSNLPTGLTANASPTHLLAEGKGKNSLINFDNVTIKGDDISITLKGNIDFKNGSIIPDLVFKNKSIKKFNVYLEQIADTDLTVSVKSDKATIKKEKEFLKTEKKIPIGSFETPTGVPAILAKGEIYVLIQFSVSGEPKVSLQFTTEERIGVRNKNGKFQGYYDPDIDVKDTQVYGEGKASLEAGPVVEGSLSAMEVLSVGLEAKAGGYAEGSTFLNKEQVASCGKFGIGLFGSGEMFIKGYPSLSSVIAHWWNNDKKIKYKYTIKTKFIDLKKPLVDMDTCTIAKDLIPDPKELSLEPGEEKEVSMSLKLYDQGTTKEKITSIESDESEFLSVKSTQEEVVTVQVEKDGKIKIKAKDTPSQTNAEIEVTYKNEKQKREATVKIPVKIKNYDPNATKGLEGIWRSEKERTYFYKIVEKGPKSIEVSGMALYEIDYTAIVDFTNIQNKVLSGKLDYISVHPAVIVDSDTGFRLEKLSKDKIQLTTGKDTRILVRASEKAMEEERALQAGQKPDSSPKPESTGRIKATYDTLNNDSSIEILSSFETIDDKKAMIFVEQRINNSNGVTSSLAGIIETEAVKQSDSTWSFSWTDNNGTKGTGTITIKGEDATLELKSERNSLTEGKGIVSHKAQLKKTS
ncbi:hypothetical protein PDJ82_07385 [Bacillus cereus group sp. TH43LC]|uniref:hypothetical protein n=1 Tax=Bacillus cereus group TaxID=86661 RepID=UPI002151037B|nr:MULTISPECIES: hypothetical protein [Bacillus cereus group]MCR6462288.1 hypothetical protein [Bacillus paranthracis]MCR9022726.1 hypothetical protein [Bacillus paranthracis]MDA1501417.1 hypothetical protein [Bacillus cereus group sp. TH43LC]